MRALIADDHPLYLDAATAHIGRSFPEADIVQARTLPETLEKISGCCAFDLILLDLFMPGMQGDSSIRQVVAEARGAALAVMSGSAAADEVIACIGAGARGFLPKTLDAPIFAAAVNMILIGGTFIPAEIVTASPTPAAPGPEADLSARERDVLAMIVAGAANKEIARQLEIQEATVKMHANRIFQKLNVKNRSQAAVKALDWDLVRR